MPGIKTGNPDDYIIVYVNGTPLKYYGERLMTPAEEIEAWKRERAEAATNDARFILTSGMLEP